MGWNREIGWIKALLDYLLTCSALLVGVYSIIFFAIARSDHFKLRSAVSSRHHCYLTISSSLHFFLFATVYHNISLDSRWVSLPFLLFWSLVRSILPFWLWFPQFTAKLIRAGGGWAFHRASSPLSLFVFWPLPITFALFTCLLLLTSSLCFLSFVYQLLSLPINSCLIRNPTPGSQVADDLQPLSFQHSR